MKLEERFAALRKERGLSQAEVAEELNVSRQAVSRWERGTSAPSTDNLMCLAKLYGVSLDHLVGDDTDDLPMDAEKEVVVECGPGGEDRKKWNVANRRNGIYTAIFVLLALLIAAWCYGAAGRGDQEVVDIGALETDKIEISETFGFDDWK